MLQTLKATSHQKLHCLAGKASMDWMHYSQRQLWKGTTLIQMYNFYYVCGVFIKSLSINLGPQCIMSFRLYQWQLSIVMKTFLRVWSPAPVDRVHDRPALCQTPFCYTGSWSRARPQWISFEKSHSTFKKPFWRRREKGTTPSKM